ncbi:hypothetical protein EDC04DRAFT_2603674 [Pisolithus marmoratus]|nr:hypothetical protein EDC04DRAFT_2603674 [Pisolithus marmoratus]
MPLVTKGVAFGIGAEMMGVAWDVLSMSGVVLSNRSFTPLAQESMPAARRHVFNGAELRPVETFPWYAEFHQSDMSGDGGGDEQNGDEQNSDKGNGDEGDAHVGDGLSSNGDSDSADDEVDADEDNGVVGPVKIFPQYTESDQPDLSSNGDSVEDGNVEDGDEEDGNEDDEDEDVDEEDDLSSGGDSGEEDANDEGANEDTDEDDISANGDCDEEDQDQDQEEQTSEASDYRDGVEADKDDEQCSLRGPGGICVPPVGLTAIVPSTSTIACSLLGFVCIYDLHVDITGGSFPFTLTQPCPVLTGLGLEYTEWGFLCKMHSTLIHPCHLCCHTKKQPGHRPLNSPFPKSVQQNFLEHVLKSHGISSVDKEFALPELPLAPIPVSAEWLQELGWGKWLSEVQADPEVLLPLIALPVSLCQLSTWDGPRLKLEIAILTIHRLFRGYLMDANSYIQDKHGDLRAHTYVMLGDSRAHYNMLSENSYNAYHYPLSQTIALLLRTLYLEIMEDPLLHQQGKFPTLLTELTNTAAQENLLNLYEYITSDNSKDVLDPRKLLCHSHALAASLIRLCDEGQGGFQPHNPCLYQPCLDQPVSVNSVLNEGVDVVEEAAMEDDEDEEVTEDLERDVEDGMVDDSPMHDEALKTSPIMPAVTTPDQALRIQALRAQLSQRKAAESNGAIPTWLDIFRHRIIAEERDNFLQCLVPTPYGHVKYVWYISGKAARLEGRASDFKLMDDGEDFIHLMGSLGKTRAPILSKLDLIPFTSPEGIFQITNARSFFLLEGLPAIGNPKAKQRNRTFQECLWAIPNALAPTLLYFLGVFKPVCSDVMHLATIHDPIFDTHIFCLAIPLPSTSSSQHKDPTAFTERLLRIARGTMFGQLLMSKGNMKQAQVELTVKSLWRESEESLERNRRVVVELLNSSPYISGLPKDVKESGDDTAVGDKDFLGDEVLIAVARATAYGVQPPPLHSRPPPGGYSTIIFSVETKKIVQALEEWREGHFVSIENPHHLPLQKLFHEVENNAHQYFLKLKSAYPNLWMKTSLAIHRENQSENLLQSSVNVDNWVARGVPSF